MNKQVFQKAFLATIPVMTGYLVLGLGFGVLLRAKGFGVLWAMLLSVGIYSGSMQFLAIDLMVGGAGLLTTALTALAVSARHVFYGISMLDAYKETGRAKPYLIYALTDETYSLVCGEVPFTGRERTAYYVFVSLLDELYWLAGSVAGALLGAVLPFSTEGMDFALTALFVTVAVEQWTTSKHHRYALVGYGAALLALLIFGKEHFLIPAMLLIVALLAAMRKGEVRT